MYTSHHSAITLQAKRLELLDPCSSCTCVTRVRSGDIVRQQWVFATYVWANVSLACFPRDVMPFGFAAFSPLSCVMHRVHMSAREAFIRLDAWRHRRWLFGWRESVGSEALRHVGGFLSRCDRWLRANCDQPNLEAYASDHTLFYATGQRHRQSFAEMDVTRSGTSFTSWIVQLCFLRASTLGSCYLFTEPKVVYDETC